MNYSKIFPRTKLEKFLLNSKAPDASIDMLVWSYLVALFFKIQQASDLVKFIFNSNNQTHVHSILFDFCFFFCVCETLKNIQKKGI